MATSAYLGLNLIDKGAQANEWGTITNDNLSAIDAALGARHDQDPSGAQGQGQAWPQFKGMMIYETANERLYISKTSSNDTTANQSFVELGGVQGFNATAADGYIYYASGASASISAGNIGLAGNVHITGQSTFDSKAHFKADVSVGGNFRVDDATISLLTVEKDASISGQLNVGGSASIGGDLRVGGTASIAGDLHVAGTAHLGDVATLSGNAFFKTTAQFSSLVTVEGKLVGKATASFGDSINCAQTVSAAVVKNAAGVLTAGGDVPSGSKMLFSGAVPSGWTALNNNNNVALRLVGTGGTPGATGGTDDFDVTFSASKATESHTLDTSEIPSHTHSVNPAHNTGSGVSSKVTTTNSGLNLQTTGATGGGGGHTHDITMDVKYVDIQEASKD